MSRQMEHLLELARRGRNPGASNAERQARRIVRCLLHDAIGLDGSASDGIADLVALVQASPQDGRDAVRAAIR